MKASIKDNFLIRDLAGEKVLISSGEQVNLSKMLIMNDTAAFIIQELQKGSKTSEDLSKLMTESYDIDYTEAYQDIEELLKQLEKLNVVTIGNDSI